MEFKEALKKLESSKEYKEFSKKNKACYLSYAFIMIDESVKEEWQIGYYNPKDDKVSTFAINEKITQNPEAEIFKDDKKVLKLELADVKITLEKALDIAEKTQKEKYSPHTPFKKIIILQKLEIGQVWNITYVTNTFKTLNMKIDSSSGKVLKDELIDFFKIEK